MNFPKFVKLSVGCLLALYGILMFVVTLKYDGMVCNYPGPVGMHQLLKIEGGLFCGIAVLLISITLIERSKNECLVALRMIFVWWTILMCFAWVFILLMGSDTVFGEFIFN